MIKTSPMFATIRAILALHEKEIIDETVLALLLQMEAADRGAYT